VYVPAPAEPVDEPEEPVAPTSNIVPQPTPRVVNVAEGHWSLVNLVSTLLLMLALLAALLRFVARPAKDEEDEEDKDRRRSNYDDRRNEDERGSHSTATRVFLALSAIAALATLVLFVLTQNLTLPMQLLDRYSALFIVLLVAGLVCAIALFVSAQVSKAKEDDERDRDRNYHRSSNSEVMQTSMIS